MVAIQYPITTLFHLSPPYPLANHLPYISHLQNASIKMIILKSNLDALLTNQFDLLRNNGMGVQGEISEFLAKSGQGMVNAELNGSANQVDCAPFFSLMDEEVEASISDEIKSIHNTLMQNASNVQRKSLEEEGPPTIQLIIYSVYQLFRDALRMRASVDIFLVDVNAIMEETYSQKERRILKQNGELEKEVHRASKLLAAYYKRRRETLLQEVNPRKTHDSLVNFRWRVDVTISNSMMSRVFIPVIWMQMTLDNGRQETFEVSLAKFHQMRLEAADVLQQMNEIQCHPMMNIHEK